MNDSIAVSERLHAAVGKVIDAEGIASRLCRLSQGVWAVRHRLAIGIGDRTQSSSIAIAILQAPAWPFLQSPSLLGQQATLVVHVLVCRGVGQIIIGCYDRLDRKSTRLNSSP